ncbi:PAC2 family protein [candidate division WOR-3 bacterium]|nr:PAC2 family protein [candidate division WOR-3 bacterium]
MELKIHKRIYISHPTMFAAWPGMGDVAFGAIDYLRRKLEAKPFAEIDISQFTTPDTVIVKNGLTRLPRTPRNIFYYRKYPDVIIFEGETQLKEELGISLANRILDLAQSLEVTRIFTGAAFPLPMSYEEPSKIYGVANMKSAREFLFTNNIKIMENGQISGLNGLLLEFARQRDIPSICFLATIPLYAVNLPNPKASKAIIETFERILKVRISTTALDLQIQKFEDEMFTVEQKIKEQIRGESAMESEEGEAPDYIKQRIENLFHVAKYDKSKAYLLKKELDKWDLFDLYEDRFLDLFKKR